MAWTFLLTDIKTDVAIADVTQLCLRASISARLNRPLTIDLELPADSAALTVAGPDGDPGLHVGTRGIKAYQDGVLRGHCIVWTLSWDGGPDNNPRVALSAVDPMIRLNYRTVFDGNGALADYTFTRPTNGGQLLRDAIQFSRTYEDADIGTPALLPIDTFTGTYTTVTDLSSVLTDTPLTIGELVSLLTDTGVVDVVLKPVDATGDGYGAGIMGQLNVYEQAGSDISATVHFDYATGLKNVSHARRVLDMSTVGNRITYELGPKRASDHWASNITGTETGAAPGSADLRAWQTMQLASRSKYGVFAETRVYDSNDDETAGRPLFHQLWKTEVTLRVNPRDLVYLTPTASTAAHPNFRPFIDYNAGDIVGINGSSFLGPPITNAKQRIYGFTVTIEDGVERVGELVTSADAEGGP